ncbi:hypothetical protein O6H91_10G105400 [Diphasiastrum complanatum]|uniref:Uncharacterized protein n=1 Tax=Diphasiastrum complanatum TaxID=34168 RepID=A0ACC2CK90_DIPCM|nr:hypothetical protein O6H91_10G105400 [Diphasiastrum complanatum]
MAIGARFVVGYALPAKKLPGMFLPSFLEHAESRGIHFVSIDTDNPLEEQGPFDAIMHKIYHEEWYKRLSNYQQTHPSVLVIDPPASIERLHNRLSMLEAVENLQLSEGEETVGIPQQSVVNESQDISNVELLTGLKFPILAKPLVANGSVKAHDMSLIFTAEGLKKVQAPVVLQEFVNHGGILFKVYVAGEYSKCVVRTSLPDVQDDEKNTNEGILSFNQISNRALEQSASAVADLLQAEMPSTNFISGLAKGLTKTLGLHLFNFDLIRDSKAKNRYNVIDINYFPGYEKLPAYESIMTDFFVQLSKDKAPYVITEIPKFALE